MRKRSVGVHDGAFHADEVSACALLLACNLVDRERIVRSREARVLEECEYVCDVGGVYDPARKRFDHHQASYTGEWSSAGMVWAYLKDQHVIDLSTYEFLNQAFLLGVDAHDNGRMMVPPGVCSFSHVISSFSPVEYDAPEEELLKAFFAALDFALGYIQRTLQRFAYTRLCKEKVALSMRGSGKVLFFDEALPWMESFFELGGIDHPAQFVVMPSRGQWKLRGIPPSLEERMQVRTALPAAWAGLIDEQLQRASGIAGAVFCHKGRFTSVWKTKADALEALKHIEAR